MASGAVTNERSEWAWLGDIWNSLVVTVSGGEVSGSANIAGADVFWTNPTKPGSNDEYIRLDNQTPNNNLQMITIGILVLAIVIVLIKKR